MDYQILQNPWPGARLSRRRFAREKRSRIWRETSVIPRHPFTKGGPGISSAMRQSNTDRDDRRGDEHNDRSDEQADRVVRLRTRRVGNGHP